MGLGGQSSETRNRAPESVVWVRSCRRVWRWEIIAKREACREGVRGDARNVYEARMAASAGKERKVV